MILLPLNKYHLLGKMVNEVRINNLFARSVVEKHVSGRIYADDMENPRTAYIVHPYGMSLLTGYHTNHEFNNRLKGYILNTDSTRKETEWMQAYPEPWHTVIRELFADRINNPSEGEKQSLIELYTRVNFRFNRNSYLEYKRKKLADGDVVVETGTEHFGQMSGSVVPMKFWDSAADFTKRGKGFTLLHDGEIASTAYSAYIHDDKLEIGIETVERSRGCGYAEITCSRLIDYCLENNYTPVWSTRLENRASCRLAEKLGFEQVLQLPFYKLNL